MKPILLDFQIPPHLFARLNEFLNGDNSIFIPVHFLE